MPKEMPKVEPNAKTQSNKTEEFLPEPSGEVIENSNLYADELVDDIIEEANLREDIELCSIMFSLYIHGIYALSYFGFSKHALIEEVYNHYPPEEQE